MARASTMICLAAGLGALAAAAHAGPVAPPAGPVGPTYKTLSEMEPRQAVQSLAGDAGSMYLINQPGSYYLTGPITGVSGKSAIKIVAPNVTLDLGGFRVTGVAGASHGIYVLADDVEIRNGTVTGFPLTCIEAGTVSFTRLRDLRVRNSLKSGLSAGWSATVEGCEAHNNAEFGIFTNDRSIVTGCKSFGNGLDGFRAGLSSAVAGCVSTHNDGEGFELGNHVTVTGCVASSNAGVGIRVDSAATITSCTSDFNAGGGVLGTGSLTVTGCTFSFNTLFGLKSLGSGSNISGCTARANTGDGISVFNTSGVTGCVCESNTGGTPIVAGIRLAGQGNRADSNMLNGNGIGIDADSGGNLVVRNSFSFNPTRVEAAAGNNVAQIIIVPGAGFTSADPWANFAH